MLILGYHRVVPRPRGNLAVTTDMFRWQLQYLLERGFRNVSLDEAAEAYPHLPHRAFAITFDDGYQDNYLHAMPLLEEVKLTATLFVTVNYVGTRDLYPWDTKRRAKWGGDVIEEDYSVTWSQLLEMQQSGIFAIGSHTLSHPELPSVDLATAEHEIRASKLVLEDKMMRPINAFCYPRGKLNPTLIDMVKYAGYTAGVVTPEVPVPRTPYTLYRVGVDGKHSRRDFAFKASYPFSLLLSTGIWPQYKKFRGRVESSKRG